MGGRSSHQMLFDSGKKDCPKNCMQMGLQSATVSFLYNIPFGLYM
jgi:hypothetical protein